MEESKSMELNETNGSQLVLKNIQELKGLRFVIPAYQRGFRWRWQQIKELIDDLYEFSDSKNHESIYCLQNITVIKKTDKDGEYYEVVDGQQRLTAIWMLVVAFRCTSTFFDNTALKDILPIYSISYDGKKSLNNYCEKIIINLGEHTDYSKAIVDDIIGIEQGDIDSRFIRDGLHKISEYKKGPNNYSFILSGILASRSMLPEGEGENVVREKQICIFWNEISSAQGGSSGMQDDDRAIERFSSLNAGKIPLTESELVKAYFINSLAPNDVPEFSLQWEEIERGMSDDEFWGFLSSKDKEYETRIDFLLDIIYNDGTSGDKSHALSLAVADELKKDRVNARNVWQKVVQCYQTLRDWYDDYYFYHMIGYIVAVEKKSSAAVIKGLYEDYAKISKAGFKKGLKEKIKNLDELKPIFGESKKKGDNKAGSGSETWSENEQQTQGDLVDIETAGDALSYNNGNAKQSIKSVLLLFNIALLLNAYEINPDNATERFSFKLYKSKDNPIEIEHINPQHLEGKAANKNDMKRWAKGVLEIIKNDSSKEYESLKDRVERADWRNQNARLIEDLEEAAKLHNISNLTLLDKKLNTSYKDNMFSIKRAHILAARFGNPVPKSIDAGKDYYKQSVIFPGTMWVFLREYSDPSDNQSSKNDTFWTNKDRTEYIRTMEESVSRLLGDHVNATPNAESQSDAEDAE